MIAASGRRLLDVPVGELLSFAWANIYDKANDKAQRKLDLLVRGRLGQDGGEIMDDPNLPESLRGAEAPDWFTTEEDPFDDQWNLSL